MIDVFRDRSDVVVLSLRDNILFNRERFARPAQRGQGRGLFFAPELPIPVRCSRRRGFCNFFVGYNRISMLFVQQLRHGFTGGENWFVLGESRSCRFGLNWRFFYEPTYGFVSLMPLMSFGMLLVVMFFDRRRLGTA